MGPRHVDVRKDPEGGRMVLEEGGERKRIQGRMVEIVKLFVKCMISGGCRDAECSFNVTKNR